MRVNILVFLNVDLPPPAKRRRGLAGSIVSTAVSAALIGTAVGLTVYRLSVHPLFFGLPTHHSDNQMARPRQRGRAGAGAGPATSASPVSEGRMDTRPAASSYPNHSPDSHNYPPPSKGPACRQCIGRQATRRPCPAAYPASSIFASL